MTDPYNLYFTPDGRSAVSVAEARRELVFYDPHTWAVQDDAAHPDCAGIDHADFTPDGRTAVFTCEFAGRVAVVDVAAHRAAAHDRHAAPEHDMGPQDIKLAPGRLGVLHRRQRPERRVGARRGGDEGRPGDPDRRGAHGLYLSRDATRLYVTNRHEGSVSVLDAYTGASLAKWRIPGRASPDMGNVTADGTQLWLSGPLRPQRLRAVHRRRAPHPQDRGRERAARAVRLAPAGPLLARPHRDHPVALAQTATPAKLAFPPHTNRPR